MFFLVTVAKETSSSMPEPENIDELEQVIIARALINYRIKENIGTGSSSSAPVPFAKKFFMQNPRPTSPQPSPATTSRILPFICPKQPSRSSRSLAATSGIDRIMAAALESRSYQRPQQRFANPGTAAQPYVPMRHLRSPCHGMAPPVTIRTAVPVFSAPPMPPPPCTNNTQLPSSVYVPSLMRTAPPVRIAPPVTIRTAVPVFASAPPVRIRKVDIQTAVKPTVEVGETRVSLVQEKEESIPVLPDTLEIGEVGITIPISEREKTAAKETERAALKDSSKGEAETARERLEYLKI